MTVNISINEVKNMGKMGKNVGKDIEATEGRKQQGIILGEFRITGNIGQIEKFRGYLKFFPKEGGWILRIPPSKVIIIPDTKERAKELMKLYKSIIKEKGKVLPENLEIIRKWVGDTEIIGNSKKGKKGKKGKKSLIDELRKLPKEERAEIISELLEGD